MNANQQTESRRNTALLVACVAAYDMINSFPKSVRDQVPNWFEVSERIRKAIEAEGGAL